MKKKANHSLINILLVDDHPIVREGIRSRLLTHKQFKIVAEAVDGEDAVRKTKRFLPDIVLMDVNMPKLKGTDATKIIGSQYPESRVIVLSMHNDQEYVMQMVRNGAKGYVLKECSPDELIHAITKVHQGETYFTTSVTNVLAQEVSRGNGIGKKIHSSELTTREKEILSYIAQGSSNKEIASKLNISIRTVETHRDHIMKKTNLHNAAGLTKFAIQNGLVKS